MNYYKVLENGVVIDTNYVFLKWQEKHGILVGCDISEANFIQSTDQTVVWRVDWLIPVGSEAGDYKYADAVEITKDEHDSLRAMLDEGKEVVVTPDEPTEPEVPEEGGEEGGEQTEEVMSVDAMRRKITALEQQVQEQTERNDFLEGCLLEMSELVYV